ncbi:2-phospho-L-lactate transferase [Ruegeria sp.]|uniref:2-phospho-L-lactate transferase n=1 Tax=Ruegeria sp. TaxID=1879320 RepID=UPI003C7B8276
MTTSSGKHILALCGGVGGAKLAFGLSQVLPSDRLTLVVNTGDDFEHLGLPICPDLDTVLYTLAGLNNRAQGWGRADETWGVFSELGQLGAPDWFQLGDKDIALHLLRRHLLEQGNSLSEVMKQLSLSLGVQHGILPMSDDPVRTMLATDQGELPFQEYFVARRCTPRLTSIRFDGAAQAKPSPGFLARLSSPDLAAVILCPSNPFLSVDPILSVPGIRDSLIGLNAPIVAVTPLIGGQAVKGPTAKICAELGVPSSAHAVADYYSDFLDGFVLDATDAELVGQIEGQMAVTTAQTLMKTDEDKKALARTVLDFAQTLNRTDEVTP